MKSIVNVQFVMLLISSTLTFATEDLAENLLKRGPELSSEKLSMGEGRSTKKQIADPSLQGPWGVTIEEVETAFTGNPHLVCIMEFGGCFKRLNQKWKEVLGWEIEEFLSTPYYQFIHPHDLEKTVKYEKLFIPSGFMNRYRHKDGSYRWLTWIGLSHLERDSKQPSFAIAIDSTFDMILKEESEKRVTFLNEHINFQSDIIKAVAELQTLYLGRLGEYGNESNTDISFQHIIQHFVRLSESEFGFIGQIFHRQDKSLLLHKTWEAHPLINMERKRLYELCKQEEGGLACFNSLVQASMEQTQPFSLDNVQGHFKKIGTLEAAPTFTSFLGVPLFSRNEMVGILALANRPCGYNKQLIAWFEPLFNLTGRIINEVNLIQSRQEAIQQCQAREEAEAKNDAKSRFLAYMSHELRTPLSGLIGLLDLIDKDRLTKEETDYLQMAQETGGSLLNILNDILDLSKIEEDKVVLEQIEFNPVQISQEVTNLLLFSAQKKNIYLRLVVDAKVPLLLIGDPIRLRQIFMNLVGNAIKFTEKGGVEIILEGEQVETDKDAYFSLTGSIKDTGIGMSSDNLESLFNPFTQADTSMNRRFGGTGLGLYITKHLCELMKGSIEVKSKEGKGTTFTFKANLPISGKGKKTSLSVSSESVSLPSTLHVLLAEDNQINQLLLRVMLEKIGCKVTLVSNGLEALNEVQRNNYNLILMDGSMPEMDGLEATRQIRLLPQGKKLPIIGVTAHAMFDDHQRFLQAGMNGYLTKPIRKETLFTEIRRCLENKEEK